MHPSLPQSGPVQVLGSPSGVQVDGQPSVHRLSGEPTSVHTVAGPRGAASSPLTCCVRPRDGRALWSLAAQGKSEPQQRYAHATHRAGACSRSPALLKARSERDPGQRVICKPELHRLLCASSRW